MVDEPSASKDYLYDVSFRTIRLRHQMKGKCQRSKSINEFKDKNASWSLDVVSI